MGIAKTARAKRKTVTGSDTPEVQLPLTGRCACSAVRYELLAPPLIVHACHCLDCQRLSGSAFVVNLWIESKFVATRSGVLESFRLKGGSGRPHEVFFCARCATYAWSRYGTTARASLFVRAGTLDEPSVVEPDVHIFTRSKVPWLSLPENARAFRTFYSIRKVWSPASLRRRYGDRRSGAS